MITKNTFPDLLISLGFSHSVQQNSYTKIIFGNELKVDFTNEKLIYPNGIEAERETTKNFSQNENFVVFECVYNLLESGYKPKHIILEKGLYGGHGMTGGFADIIVQNNNKEPYLLIECKTADEGKNKEFSRAWAKMEKDGGQLFNYYTNNGKAKWLCLYASNYRNDKVEQTYHLISMEDNRDYLKNNKQLISFEKVRTENGSKSDYFKVWTETYQQDFITHNLFESEAFHIGKRPYNIQDLKEVDNEAIQKKYHQFATIMRKHNVSARENAFDKLVNLFLCKVVDEKHNKDDLKVYWKGAASDNHYNLQDRLQQLYQIGMKEFLGEDVTYISEETLDNAFYLFKNHQDETKRTVLDYFTQLKFYSNNPFAFLDVHNKKLFFQNAVILKEIVQMLQDIKLKNENERHQFLGDLFEGFLDQGVKQSEGQFFTPMPIVKFLISSLPLTQLLSGEKPPKVIDYACGAGHFLTEFATQIQPLLTSGQIPQNFYKNIYGIEKEYRLSKVAKVSAFMYGQDEMNIIYADALAQNPDQTALMDNSFSLLVANPPYSVKGFLSTLSEDDKQRFQLTQFVSDEESFNSIETFFIEKAKQLLKENGIAVIVLPSTILTNGKIYVKCREIILQYFDLIAITELGSGTFGKTGTNTATLFLRRKGNSPELTKHYQNRVAQWQNGNFNFDGLFEDAHLLQAYCSHCGFDFETYKGFLKADKKLPETIAQTEIFGEYLKLFEKKKLAKNADKDLECLKFMKEIEADKLHFFMLAQSNGQDVLVVKSPTDNKAIKSFLGYEWSSAKGNEGIKYLGTTTTDEDEAINRNKGIFQIQTPLFNPNNLNDDSKINTYIRKHFMGEHFAISEENQSFVSLLSLTDMLDFSRTSFDKSLRTSIQKKIEIKSKYPLVKLYELVTIIRGVTYGKVEQVLERTKNIILPADNISLEGHLTINKEIFLDEAKELDDTKRLKANDIFICFSSGSKKHIGKVCFISEDTSYYAGGFMGILRSSDKINAKYLFNILNQENMRDVIRQSSSGSNINNLSNSIGEIKIPLSPFNIQQQIVEECEKVDEEFNQTRMKIEEYRAKIAKIFNDLEVISGGVKRLKISELCDLNQYSIQPEDNPKQEFIYVDIDAVENGTGKYSLSKKILGSEAPSRARRMAKIGSTIISTVRPYLKGFAYIEKEIKNSVFSTGFAILQSKDESILLNKMVYYIFMFSDNLMKQMEKSMPKGQYPSINKTDIENFIIPIPPLAKQQEIVAEIEGYEVEITKLENIMTQSNDKKKAILDKYLL